MRHLLALSLLPLFAAGCSNMERGSDAPPPIEPAAAGRSASTPVEPLQVLLLYSAEPRLIIIDVNTPADYRRGHIPRSLNIPWDELEVRMHDLPRDSVVVTSCTTGARSGPAAAILAAHGLDVRGYCSLKSWQDAGRTLEMSK